MAGQGLMAGAAKVDITPKGKVWMDGMPRSHESEGVHDPLSARALVIVPDGDKSKAVVLVSCDICAIDAPYIGKLRQDLSKKTGIPAQNMIIAATHTHSGPALHGFFNPKAEEYTNNEFLPKVAEAVCKAADSLRPAAIGCASGEENTISYYRRLWTKQGTILMNWEEYPKDQIVGPAEEGDPEVAVVRIVSADDPKSAIATVFNHAGHPNVMSGENFMISADYPGLAAKIVEEKFGGVGMFFNAAQGSVDIDGLKDRDWEGVDRTGTALGTVAVGAAEKVTPSKDVKIKATSRKFSVPVRTMTDKEKSWAEDIMAKATGEIVTRADGVGDEWKANLFLELDKKKGKKIDIEMVAVALGDIAFLAFPGEVFTEISNKIKKQSPFKCTRFIDLANNYTGYYPTKKAISEGGYAVETRNCDDTAEEIIISNCLEMLKELAA